jgi:hypothetical protein
MKVPVETRMALRILTAASPWVMGALGLKAETVYEI